MTVPLVNRALPFPLIAPSEVLADLAVRALVEEALLTPKPGLVDLRGPGAHDDLSLSTMLRSAESLRGTFADVAAACEGRRPDLDLRETLGAIGRAGEAEMLGVTGGANTHRGAIWTLGLLVAGAVLASPTDGEHTSRVAASAARIARLPDVHGTPQGTNGARVRDVYGVAGRGGRRGRDCRGWSGSRSRYCGRAGRPASEWTRPGSTR